MAGNLNMVNNTPNYLNQYKVNNSKNGWKFKYGEYYSKYKVNN
jgi:hypothetical protein